mgnify:CR=1 FL=1
MKYLKKWFIYETVFIIVGGSLLHFVYDLFKQNKFVGIFALKNESIFEYLKFGYKKNNFITAKAISLYSGIILVLFLVYGYTGIIGKHNVILDILIFIISVLLSQYFGFKLLTSKYQVNSLIKAIASILIVVLIILVVHFSFYPPSHSIFKDPTKTFLF